MTTRIRKVAVLGAGVMGSGIAAHLANAGVRALLLDIVPPKAAPGEDTASKSFRNKFALGALANLRKQKPSPIVSEQALPFIEVGNFEDDLARLAECDWVIEVVKEDLAVKQAIFAKVEQHRAPGTIISSNTSGLSIEGMLEGRGADFRKNFLVTHFFNPVRYMKLLELVAGTETDPEVVQARPPLRRGGARQGHRLRQGHHQLHRQPRRHLRDDADHRGDAEGRAVHRGGGQDLRPRHGPPQVRRVPHRGHRGPGHLHPRGEELLRHAHPGRGARGLRRPRLPQKMVEKGMLGDKSGGGFYKKDRSERRQGHPRARPEDARVPAAGEGALRVAGRRQGRRERARARGHA